MVTNLCKKIKHKPKPNNRIDKCMVGLIKFLNRKHSLYYAETLGSCCGHGKYHMTVVVKNKHGLIYDLISNKVIPRKRRFYKRDDEGYYYIPEVENE